MRVQSVPYLLIISIVLFSCTIREDPVPVNYIQPDKMVKIMCDVFIIESIYNHNKQGNDSTLTARDCYLKAFEEHGVTDSLFNVSLDYYTTRPGILEQIYSDAITELSTRQADLNNQGINKTDTVVN